MKDTILESMSYQDLYFKIKQIEERLRSIELSPCTASDDDEKKQAWSDQILALRVNLDRLNSEKKRRDYSYRPHIVANNDNKVLSRDEKLDMIRAINSSIHLLSDEEQECVRRKHETGDLLAKIAIVVVIILIAIACLILPR